MLAFNVRTVCIYIEKQPILGLSDVLGVNEVASSILWESHSGF
jgi:hypothetical protein